MTHLNIEYATGFGERRSVIVDVRHVDNDRGRVPVMRVVYFYSTDLEHVPVYK